MPKSLNGSLCNAAKFCKLNPWNGCCYHWIFPNPFLNCLEMACSPKIVRKISETIAIDLDWAGYFLFRLRISTLFNSFTRKRWTIQSDKGVQMSCMPKTAHTNFFDVAKSATCCANRHWERERDCVLWNDHKPLQMTGYCKTEIALFLKLDQFPMKLKCQRVLDFHLRLSA